MSSPTFEIKLADEVEPEIQEIFHWYLLQSSQAANSFINALEILIDFLNSNPHAFSRQRKNFRIAYLKRFPYAVVYEIAGNTIVILRIIHTSRQPRKRFRKLRRK